jgi:tetratricopeptide (TPR) repeat protein
MTLRRAAMLYDKRRYDLAADEARRVLAADPGDAHAHVVLSLALTGQKRLMEACQEAQAAIAVAPDLSLAHSALAQAMAERSRFAQARQSAMEATRLDGRDPQNYSLLANIELGNRKWKAAYEVSGRGLAIDAHHPGLLRVRSLAAAQLGRLNEGQSSSLALLRLDPNRPNSMATQGYQLLHAGRFREARSTFAEALRLDPTNRLARHGVIETIKASNFVYRWILRYLMWASRQSGGRRFVIWWALGIVLSNLSRAAFANPEAFWWALPLVAAWLAVVASIILAPPLSNLALTLHPQARYLLEADERDAGMLVGLLLAATLVSSAAFLAGYGDGLFLAALPAMAIVPTWATFRAQPGWPRWVVGAFASVAVVIGTAAAIVALAGGAGFDVASPAWHLWVSCELVAGVGTIVGFVMVRVQPAR